MNSAVLIGRISRDPEYHTTDSGMQIFRMSLAVDRGKDQNGNDKGADFPRVVVFGKQAENCNKYLSKGKMVGVQGRIQTGSYEKDGVTYYTTDVIADRVEFLSPSEKKADNKQEQFSAISGEVPF